jgi:hypothetical protein
MVGNSGSFTSVTFWRPSFVLSRFSSLDEEEKEGSFDFSFFFFVFFFLAEEEDDELSGSDGGPAPPPSLF